MHGLTKSILLCSVGVLTLLSSIKGQNSTTVGFDSGDQAVYSNAGKTMLLSAGAQTVTGDGTVLQLGYYTNATTGNYFSGNFVPLSGQGTANTSFAYTSIGDLNSNGASNGTFALSLTFTTGNSSTGNNLPATGTPLTIRFYDATTVAGSMHYNDVSDAQWTWQAPTLAGTNVALSLNDTGLMWLGGDSSAFYTSQPTVIPEPSTVVLLVGVLVVVAGLRLRRRTA